MLTKSNNLKHHWISNGIHDFGTMAETENTSPGWFCMDLGLHCIVMHYGDPWGCSLVSIRSWVIILDYFLFIFSLCIFQMITLFSVSFWGSLNKWHGANKLKTGPISGIHCIIHLRSGMWRCYDAAVCIFRKVSNEHDNSFHE